MFSILWICIWASNFENTQYVYYIPIHLSRFTHCTRIRKRHFIRNNPCLQNVLNLPDDDDSLPLEKSLGDDRGEATEEMAAAIDDQRFGGKTHLDKTVNAKQIGLCNKSARKTT